MKKLFKIRVFTILCLVSIISCNKPYEKNPVPDSELNKSLRTSTDVDKLYDSKSNLKREFGQALIKSMKESKLLRDLIRIRALERFDKDYDVLYGMIADEKLENNVTVNDLILKHISDKKVLKALENDNPTLTILVPELPENSFNAEKWNTATDIPRVAVRLTASNDVPVIDLDGSERVLEWKFTPAFPVLVIKDNERVISEKDRNFNNKTTRSFQSEKGKKYKFTFDNYDAKRDKNKRVLIESQLDPKIIESYNTYLNVDGWQRDLIYYNIKPGQDRGAFSYDFKEKITSFTLVGDPVVAYNKIADQTDDPHVIGITTGSHWTGGSFDFKVNCLINAKNGVGTELVTGFGAMPDQIFDLTYERIHNNWFGADTYALTNIALKKMYLNNVELINWDLNDYASSIKIRVEEVDITTSTQEGESSTVKFASNFGIDDGILKKFGFKFGGSLEITQTQTYQRTFTQGNDDLEEVIVNFGDKVIINKLEIPPLLPLYTTREYPTGYYSISVEPIRVQ